MTKRIYRATVNLECGAQVQEEGSLARCIQWCEDMMRANRGEITITIRDWGETEVDDKE